MISNKSGIIKESNLLGPHLGLISSWSWYRSIVPVTLAKRVLSYPGIFLSYFLNPSVLQLISTVDTKC